jgi:fatty acid desaturase
MMLSTQQQGGLRNRGETSGRNGERENVCDHCLNTQTVLIKPVGRFIYPNMNYHTEHHMFKMILSSASAS